MKCFTLSCALAALVVSFMAVSDARAALVASWPFEEGSGTVTADASGPMLGGTGDLAGGVTWAPSPVQGSDFSLFFDGTDDTVNTMWGGIGGADARSVAFWVKTTDTGGGGGGIVGWGDSTTNGAKVHIRPNNDINNGTIGAIRTEIQGAFNIGEIDIADGKWHHVVSVFGGTTMADVMHYVDGSLDSALVNNALALNTATNADPVSIGSRIQTGTQQFFQGFVDNVQFFDHALSAGEVQSIFAAAQPVKPIAALSYNATTDSTPGNDVAEDEIRVFNPGAFDWNLNGNPVVALDLPVQRTGAFAGYSFDGSAEATYPTNDFQTFPGNPTDDSASFELWFRPSDLAGQEVVWEVAGATDGSSFTLNDQTLQFIAKDAAENGAVSADLSALVGDGDLIHAVGVVNLENDLVELFINGALADSMAYLGDDWAGNNASGLGGAGGGAVGGSSGAFGDLNSYGNFVGEVAIFRFYNEALTADEVFALNQMHNVIPEPASAALLGLGALGLLMRRRRSA